MSDEDPFDCFGGDDESDDDNNAVDVNSTALSSQTGGSSSGPRRDPGNGILAFHVGTEHSLLHHVEQHLLDRGGVVNTVVERANQVLDAIDEFSLRRHWMMHVGNEKGAIVEKFVKECCDSIDNENSSDRPILFVELGTYCGYSSILLAKAMTAIGRPFEIYTVEVVESHAQVAQKMINLAGLNDSIHGLMLDPYKESLSALLKRSMPTDTTIDFLFVDHDKSLYLSDLQELEENTCIQKGCFVAADNVIFAKIDDYRQYISDLAKEGIVTTRLDASWLEYCEPDHEGDESKKHMMRDGIELSVYLKHPLKRS